LPTRLRESTAAAAEQILPQWLIWNLSRSDYREKLKVREVLLLSNKLNLNFNMTSREASLTPKEPDHYDDILRVPASDDIYPLLGQKAGGILQK
jgi:hypothetical protein